MNTSFLNDPVLCEITAMPVAYLFFIHWCKQVVNKYAKHTVRMWRTRHGNSKMFTDLDGP